MDGFKGIFGLVEMLVASQPGRVIRQTPEGDFTSESVLLR